MTRKNTTREKDSVLAVIILLLLVLFIFKNRVWIYLALILSFLSILSPLATAWLHSVWNFLTEILGRISGTIILTVVFILILMPTAILKKWFGKKEMILKKGNIRSTFQIRNHEYTEQDFDNPW